MSTEPITAYCMKCRAKREMTAPQAIYTSKGAPATSGICPVCGTRLFKMGLTPAHANAPKPEAAPKPAPVPKVATGKQLVIVESPAKARTVGRFLGRDYVVKASIGHVRDLPRSSLGVDIKKDFQPKYLIPKGKREVIKDLQQSLGNVDGVYLATDPDREGEAIAWHLVAALSLDDARYRRVVFHEITQRAVAEAFAHPRGLDMQLVNAQQARRILDRLVGYEISPLLWKKVRSRLSAGRVQSVALRLVVEREREIQAFVPVEYWSIEAELAKRDEKRQSFIAKLARIDGKEVDLKNESDTLAIVRDLETATYIVAGVEKGERRRFPAAPFTTSTMQQEAGRRLGFAARRTMATAQMLYEGVNIGEGRVGLITYMRTDSVNVAAVAQAEARAYINETFGPQYLPPSPPHYKTRAKKAQEAHEAIRPTSVRRTPAAVKQYLSADQYRLYELIWRRFVASQMVPAIYDTTSVDVRAGHPEPGAFSFLSARHSEQSEAKDLPHPPLSQREREECPSPSPLPEGEGMRAEMATAIPPGEMEALTAAWRYLFRATGSVLRFPGFLRVYSDQRVEGEEQEEKEGGPLPELTVGELLDLLRLIPEQHFTEPPPRYTEATLVKALEELGIGRPSTYAPILTTIQVRGYVTREGRQLVPTELGFTVNDLLVEHFPTIMDYAFTAHMEGDLDLIADGDKEWVGVLREFYGPFSAAVQTATARMPKVQMAVEETGLLCPQCGSKVVVKGGRFGKFLSCSKYPTCKYKAPYLIKTGARCPQCGGELVERKSKKGRTFYGCSNYPKCNFTVSNRPLPEPCPNCGGLLTDAGKKGRACLKCGQLSPAAQAKEQINREDAKSAKDI